MREYELAGVVRARPRGVEMIRVPSFPNRRTDLVVRWFDTWEPVLDQALESLPTGDYPHDLYRLLCEQRSDVTKQIALVVRDDSPVAVVGLRRRSRLRWEPVSTYLVPGIPFPVIEGRVFDVLGSLGCEVFAAWWRIPAPPSHPKVRVVQTVPTYRMATSDDFEAYWREQHQLRSVLKSRRRCADLQMSVNASGSAEWVMESASRRWRAGGPPDSWLADRVAVGAYLESKGLQYTLVLSDGDLPVGGETLIVHGDELVSVCTHRDFDYDRLGVGVRLLDWSFSFASERRFSWIDIGGGFEYKRKWAPESGSRWDLEVSFPWRNLARRGIRTVTRLAPTPPT